MDRATPWDGRDDVVSRDMASVDWASTPLGPPRDWVPELRAVVAVLLSSRFPMWMAWGPELTMLYNDAYRRDTLRDKHPWALGRPSDQVWAEVWDDVTPQVRAVLDEGRSTWNEDLMLYLRRRGWPEETFHTFSYSPLTDGAGVVRGLLCVVAETTERVLGQRRMTFLRDLTAATTGVRSTPAVLRAARAVLAEDPRDLPVGLLYLIEPDAPGRARLVADVGMTRGGPAAPAVVDLDAPDEGPWPLARARAGTLELVPPPVLARELPPGCDRVALVALVAPEGLEGGLLGVLVLGLSRHLAFDRPYRDFVELVGGQVTSAVLEARAIESEHERAEALAELDRTRRRFFADASHELRTPLTLIQAPLAGLLADPDGDPELRRTELEVAARNARRLTRLVGDLLEISRLHDGAAGPSRVAVDLGRLTAEVAATVASAMARAGLEYVVEVPDEGPVATVDPRGWERIVGNLVANALKHTPAGSVTVRLATVDDEVVLTVADTGVGVPAADLPHLFERFRRVEGAWARTAEGSGIGLALVADLAADHGGRVAVASETAGPGAGSTFTVALPAGVGAEDRTPDADASRAGDRSHALAEETATWVPEGPPAGEPDEPADGVGEPVGRVLVVDDNADMRAYMTRLLAPRATVRTAGDGDAALEAALADPPDMVVSDVMMPGRDGLSLLAALRADPRTARVPVLLVSARAGEEAAVAGLAAQADDYLVKPFAPGELQARVLAHLQLGRARREAEARFVAVADLAPAMIWVADGDGSRVFLNAAWTRFTGRAKDDDLGDGWHDRVHPDDRAGYDALRDRARSLGRGWETDVRLRHADGTYHRVVEQAVVLPGPGGGGPGGHVGSCVDVQTRLRQADRSRLLAEVGVAMSSSETVEGRLLELRRVLAEARLGDRVRLLPADGPEPADGQRARRRPLVVRGRTLRVLELERDPATAPWTADDDALIDEIVERTVPALDNALLRADERVAAERLALVQRTTASLSAAATPVEVARAVVTHVGELLGPATMCAVFEYDAPSRELRMLVRRPRVPDDRSHGDLVGLDTDTLLTRAVRSERPIWVHEPAWGSGDGDGQDPSLVALMRARGLREVVTIPLIAAGRVVGAVAVAPADGDTHLDVGQRTTLVALAEPCGVALDRARLYRAEHEIAQTLQRSLLPQDLPDVARLPIAVRYLPGAVGTSAGGDWYDVVEIDERRVGIVVGDVVGQGTAAAAVMGQLRASLSGYLLAGRGPAAALDLLDLLVARVPGARASTAICLVIDVGSGEVRWSRAGHLPALLCDGEQRFLSGPEGHGPMLGLGRLRQVERTEGVVTIEPGASVVLYTDGLVERRGESLDEGLERLAAVAGAVPDRPPEVLAAGLIAELAPTEAVDDVAVVVTRLAPPPLHDRLPAEPSRLAELRRAVRRWSRRAGLADDVVEDLQLALGEAATNAVEHAYGPQPPPGAAFSVRLTALPAGAVAVEVTDEGAWRATPPEPGHRGRGLTMIRALASDVAVEGGPAGTRVSFTVPAVHDRDTEGTPPSWSTGSSDGRDSASRRSPWAR